MNPFTIPEGEATALICGASGSSWSLSALAGRARRVGALLAARGVCRGDRVTIQGSNRAETAIACLAMIERGVVLVPIHPRLTALEARALRDDADAALHLEDADLDEVVRSTNDLPIAPPDVAAMLYTSGTSGRPKGALLSHEALAASAAASAENLGWTASDRWLLTLPLCHVGGLSVLTRCLLARRPAVILPRFDPERVVDAIVRYRTTIASMVPTMLDAALAHDPHGALSKLRAVLVGGAALSPALRARSVERGVPCLATYGLTEACSQVATQPPSAALTLRADVGPPLSSLSLRIVGDDGSPCGVGGVGQIELRGRSLMLGYRGQPPLGGGWFNTGDHGALDADGALTVHGRRSDLIVSGGENVYPAEVERVVLSHPAARQCLVFGVDDPVWGQRVAMLLVCDPASAGALRAWLPTALAGFKRPRLVAVVDDLPVLPSGKPDRRGALAIHRDALTPW